MSEDDDIAIIISLEIVIISIGYRRSGQKSLSGQGVPWPENVHIQAMARDVQAKHFYTYRTENTWTSLQTSLIFQARMIILQASEISFQANHLSESFFLLTNTGTLHKKKAGSRDVVA